MTRNASQRRPGQDGLGRRVSTPEESGRHLDEWVATALAEQAARTGARPPETAAPAAAHDLSRSGGDEPAIVSDAVGALGRRLGAMEQRFDRDGSSSLDEAFAAIQRIEDRLARELGPTQASGRDPAGRASGARAPLGRRALKPVEEVQSAVDEIRAWQNGFAEAAAGLGSSTAIPMPPPAAEPPHAEAPLEAPSRPTRARAAAPTFDVSAAPSSSTAIPMPPPAPRAEPALRAEPAEQDFAEGPRDPAAFAARRSRGPMQDMVDEQRAVRDHSAELARERAFASQARILESLRLDLGRLTGQLETIKPAAREAEALRSEIESLRGAFDGLATRDDLGRIAHDMEMLSQVIADLRVSGRNPAATASEIEALHAEIRALAAAPRTCDASGLHRRIDGLADKLDDVAARGLAPDMTASLSSQILELRHLLDEAANPRALSELAGQILDLKRDLIEVAQRQVDTDDFTSLRIAVDDVRSSLLASRETAQARHEDDEPIGAMLAALVDKVERAERKMSGPDGLDQLERQIEALSARIGHSGSRDPGVAELERSMVEVIHEIAAMRETVVEVAHHAARAAVAETLGSAPRGNDLAAHLDGLRVYNEASDTRTQRSLQDVHRALEDVAHRIGSLEGEIGEVRRSRAAGPAEPVPPRFATDRSPPRPASSRHADPSDLPDGRSRPAPAAASGAPAEADEPLRPEIDEILLEPGAARPVAPSGRAPAAAAPSDQDIKSSFIAAARRAAQAAATETVRAEPESRIAGVATTVQSSASPLALAQRLKTIVDRRRKPLLLSAAALILALGAFQMMRSFSGGPSSVTAAAPPARLETQAKAVVPPALPAPTTRSVEPTESAASAPAAPATAAALPDTEPGAPGADATAAGPTAGTAAALSPKAPETNPNALPAGLKSAATSGNAAALFELATRTADGRGVARDPKGAAALFEKAAEKGLPPAQYRLGNVYEKGVGVTRDIELAKSWYRRAAENGNIRAMHNLAVLIAEGQGKPDYPSAVSWFQKAADYGVRDSQFNLAVLYARGMGVTQDLSKAYFWLAVAAMQGDEDAGRKRDEVAPRLSATELAKQKTAVDRWKALPSNPAANDVAFPLSGWAAEAPIKRASR